MTISLTLLRTLCASMLLFSKLLFAANQGSGEVSMQGRIIASACAIDTESRDQTINLGHMPISRIIRDGQGESHPFSIKLVNCVLERSATAQADWRYFEITFDGENDSGLFGLYGEAKGIALQITDAQGQSAIPGKPLSKSEIEPKAMMLSYSMRLVGNNQIVESGRYYSTVRYKMDYY
ncbi:fimbrial protein [Serratia sp. NA_112.1]|uniref:fimbrial protein n=1 Tax=unclassified Serratia (in: enterobacteria) TaxID=2647522 RepID=UPI004046E0BE